MDDPRQPARDDVVSHPDRERDEVQPASEDKEVSDWVVGRGESTIVLIPRPFAYRAPVGTPEPDSGCHPKRRRTDLDPQK